MADQKLCSRRIGRPSWPLLRFQEGEGPQGLDPLLKSSPVLIVLLWIISLFALLEGGGAGGGVGGSAAKVFNCKLNPHNFIQINQWISSEVR